MRLVEPGRAVAEEEKSSLRDLSAAMIHALFELEASELAACAESCDPGARNMRLAYFVQVKSVKVIS